MPTTFDQQQDPAAPPPSVLGIDGAPLGDPGDDDEYEDDNDDDAIDDGDDLDAAMEHGRSADVIAARAAQRQRRRRKTKSGKHRASPSLETMEKRAESAAMDYDEWLQRYDFNIPGFYSKLVRLSPEHYEGVFCKGELEHRDGQPFTTPEIQARFGGGIYEIRIYGPRHMGDKFRPMLGRKRIDIAGPPNLGEMTKEQRNTLAKTGVAPSHAAIAAGADPSMVGLAGPAQAGMVGIVGEQLKWAREQAAAPRGSSVDVQLLSQMSKPYENSQAVIREAAEARVRAEREAADREVRATRERLEQMQQEREKDRQDTDRRIAEASSTSNQLLTTLLPNIWQNARDQTADVVKATDQQLARVEASHKAETEALHRFYQIQIDNQRTLFVAQMESLKSADANQITLLQQQLQLSVAKIDALERECQRLRDEVLKVHQEQAQQKDPLKQMEWVQQFTEVARSVVGGGNDSDDLGEDAGPAMKLLNNALPMLNNFSEVIKQKFTGGGGMYQPAGPAAQQALQAQQQAMLQQQQAATAMAQRAARPRQRQLPPAPTKPATRLKREDLQIAVQLLNGAYNAGTPPARLAETSVGQIDNEALRALAIRNPQKVIDELSRAGILTGAVAEPGAGHEYLITFLTRLRELLVPGAAPAAPAAAEPAATEPD